MILGRARFRSLTARLIVGAAVWVAAGLGTTGIALYGMFSHHVERELDSDLEEWLGVLVRALHVDGEGRLRLTAAPTDPRFDRPRSGWYWQVVGTNGVLLASHSLDGAALRIDEPPRLDQVVHVSRRGPHGDRVRAVDHQVLSPVDAQPVLISVTGSMEGASDEVLAFEGIMLWTLVFLGSGLVVAVYLQVKIGLEPLYRLRDQLAAVRDGSRARIAGEYPTEVAPLAAEVNALLDTNAKIVERARTELGNLAHALKTPLTILANESARSRSRLAEIAHDQIALMRRQVDHHLIRARTAAAVGVLGARVPVDAVLDDLRRTLAKIYAGRGVRIELRSAPSVFFAGEREDLEEMLGNLVDNACKWADAHVLVTVEQDAHTLRIAVEDDGPGLDPELYGRVLERGARLDEAKPGSGLGLSIVRDIAELYGGSIALGAGASGGLRALLVLPVAPVPAASPPPTREPARTGG